MVTFVCFLFASSKIVDYLLLQVMQKFCSPPSLKTYINEKYRLVLKLAFSNLCLFFVRYRVSFFHFSIIIKENTLYFKFVLFFQFFLFFLFSSIFYD